jgi:hypothetical protein
MTWFRSHRRSWGWMALLALVLQLGLSFGHVHGINADHPAAALAATDQAGDPPAGNGEPNDADYCAICAILALLTGAQVANAPVMALPVAPAAIERQPALEKILSEPQRVAFRSRAPPQA